MDFKCYVVFDVFIPKKRKKEGRKTLFMLFNKKKITFLFNLTQCSKPSPYSSNLF